MKRILIKLTGSLLILGISLTLFASFSSLTLGSSLNSDASYMETDDIQLTEVPVNTITDQVAEEPAKYNFASAQGASSLRVVPGGEVKGVIRFYNIDGNRTTRITLEAVQAAENWEVEIVPPLHDTEVQFGGHAVTVTENLHVEPTELSPRPIEDAPEGMVCLTVGNRGYTLAKVATIIVRVPKFEEAGTEGAIKITAVASWLGQSGTATISQTRDFDFSVIII